MSDPTLLDTKPEHWADWFIVPECNCASGSVRMFSMLDFKQYSTLGALAELLRCKVCGKPPDRVEMWSNQGQSWQPAPAKIRVI